MDQNGIIRERQRGPITGFDRPFDIVRGEDGRLYVSEFRGNRVNILSPDGRWSSSFGSKVRGEGELVGPSYMALDEEGYVYVSEYGNRRISKFSPEGEFILSFGRNSTDGFNGFISPTGLACLDKRVYAADSVYGAIYVFDSNGSFLGEFVSGLSSPEGLFLVEGERLFLAADGPRILSIEADSAIVREVGAAGAANSRVLSARLDINGNILAPSFNGNELKIMQDIDDLASGLFVQIERVVTQNFPDMSAEISVQDRRGRPVVGLSEINFVLTEGPASISNTDVSTSSAVTDSRAASNIRTDVSNMRLVGSANEDSVADIVILAERSLPARAARADFEAAFRDVYVALRDSGVKISGIVSAGARPEHESFNLDSPASITRAAAGRAPSYTDKWRFDSGLRLAATDLLPLNKKRAVLFITTGELGEAAFEQYSVSELLSYINNNSIYFYTLVVGTGAPSPLLRYLSEETGGKVERLRSPEGAGADLRNIAGKPSGIYFLRWISRLPTDFGRAFLKVEAEVYLLERSGRDSMGYFAPQE
jgi:DNA-binding beta-propeller fold protein YncE